MYKHYNYYIALMCVLCMGYSTKTYSQAEFMPWGNLNGIRIDGQLIKFSTGITAINKDGNFARSTGKERQKPKYKRDGKEQTVTTNLDSLFFIEKVMDSDKGHIKVNVKYQSRADSVLKGIYFYVEFTAVPQSALTQIAGKQETEVSLADINNTEQALNNAGGIKFTSAQSEVKIICNEPSGIILPQIKNADHKLIRVYFPIQTGIIHNGDAIEKNYDITVSGNIDTAPAILSLDTSVTGRTFAGFGGNFRLQNPKFDPEVINYCLNNLRVAWGRVEMPWRNWQPAINTDPIQEADKGNLNPHVKESMEMAQRLGKTGMPVVLTAWAPPAWAVVGELHNQPTPAGVWGNPLNRENLNQIYKSITDYIIYLKQHYGVEVSLFSFNESDLGINIRQTAAEHDDLIKGLGAYFASKGLKTKLLLGDNSDATSYHFIDVAMNDPEAIPYIGAISFHSWRGWDTPTLQKWADAAKKLNLPLIVGEGSIDAAAWAYPSYFLEQSYALEEISLYTKLLAICQPISILQWQLTSDYSPLIGDGIFGTEGPLRPTQRFWNLKQLASTPQDLAYMPITVNRDDIACAALGNNTLHSYTIHLVNNGAKRTATITGLPASVKKLTVYITDKNKEMKKASSIKVKDKQATFTLSALSYTTLVSE